MFQILINREEKENFFFKILKIEKRKRMKIQFSRARGSERGQYFSRFETLAHYWVKVVFFAPNIFTEFLALRKYYRTYLQNFLRSEIFFTKQNGKNRKYSQLLYKKRAQKRAHKSATKRAHKSAQKRAQKSAFLSNFGQHPLFFRELHFFE